jgi:hypothetical protein
VPGFENFENFQLIAGINVIKEIGLLVYMAQVSRVFLFLLEIFSYRPQGSLLS